MPLVKLKNKIDRFDTVEISINYNLGGLNYYNYKEEKRGYYIHFTPCNVREEKYGTIKETEIFHNKSFKCLIMPVNRKSDKKLKILQDILDKNLNELVENYEISNNAAYLFVNIMYKDYING